MSDEVYFDSEFEEKLCYSDDLLKACHNNSSFNLEPFWLENVAKTDSQELLESFLTCYKLEDLESPTPLFDAEEKNLLSNSIFLWSYLWANDFFGSKEPFHSKFHKFLIFFIYLFDRQLGSGTEFLINHYLTESSDQTSTLINKNLKSDFKENFLYLQKKTPFLFAADFPIGSHTLGVRYLIFKKSNLLKISRIALTNYNSAFWSNLSPSARFKFLQAMVIKTRELGNYSLINRLFNPILPADCLPGGAFGDLVSFF